MQDVDTSLSFAQRHPAVRIMGIIWGSIAASLAFASALIHIPTELGAAGMVILFISLVGLAIATAAFGLEYVVAQRKWAQHDQALRTRISDLEQQLSANADRVNEAVKDELPADTRQRFEEIERKGVRLGWIEFTPTLKVNDGGKIVGPGPGLLADVFNDKLEFVDNQSDWSNVIPNLNAGLYDVIATPLYDIRERREHVEFTTPIFYADIGIFVARSNDLIHDALSRRTDLEFPEVVRLLSPLSDTLHFCVHPGELQDKMVSKYFKGSAVKEANIAHFDIKSALRAMVGESKEYRSDLYFCERIQGEGHYLFESGDLINILAAGQLLFPVAFAVRKGDDTLRKYMNLRLMTIDGEQSSGIQQRLLAYTTDIVQPSLVTKLGEYFLRRRGSADRRKPDRDQANIFNLKK